MKWLLRHPYFYGTALALLAVALQNLSFGALPPLLLPLLAITIACWITGPLSGTVCTLTAAFASYLSTGQSGLPPVFIIFTAEGLLITWFWHLTWTSRLKLEDQIASVSAQCERAEESNRIKHDFIANMSHEIRAPLSAVLGFSDLLGNANLTPEDRKTYTERLNLNAATLTRLVSSLLDVTEIDSPTFIGSRKKIVLADFLQNLYSTFLNAAQEKKLKFQVQLRGQLPTFIESDPEQLNQILKQVIDNAIHYTETGLIKLTVTSAKTTSGRREIALIVSDTGIGINTEVKKKLFTPFSSNSASSPQTHGGTGVGLTLARKLARELGGDIRLAKTNTNGSTFLITIDAGPIDSAHDFFDQLTLSNPTFRKNQDEAHALAGTHILVVDDSSDSAFLVARILKDAGAEVKTADRGLKGVEIGLQERPDLIIMDLEMPEMDGNESIRRLRTGGFEKPIIALSAHVMKEDQATARNSGSTDFLMKPVSRKRLLEMTERYVQFKETSHELFVSP